MSTLSFISATPIPHRAPIASVYTNISPRPTITMVTTTTPKQRVLVPIGNGSEEIETSCIVDTLRRAGAEVTVASVEPSTTVKMSRSMNFVADTLISSIEPPYDCVALPGGMPGAQRLAESDELKKLVGETGKNGGLVAAICAAPAVALAGWGMLDGKRATCYPAGAFREKVKELGEGDVVKDEGVVTATGPGTALKWSLEVVEVLYGTEMAEKLAGEMLATR